MSKKEANETKEPVQEITVEQAQEIVRKAEEVRSRAFWADIEAVCRSHGMTLDTVTHIVARKI